MIDGDDQPRPILLSFIRSNSLSFFFILDNSSTVSLNFICLTNVNHVKYSKPLPSIQHFTLCHWTKLSQMGGDFATVLSYASSDTANAILITLRKVVGVTIHLNNGYL